MNWLKKLFSSGSSSTERQTEVQAPALSEQVGPSPSTSALGAVGVSRAIAPLREALEIAIRNGETDQQRKLLDALVELNAKPPRPSDLESYLFDKNRAGDQDLLRILLRALEQDHTKPHDIIRIKYLEEEAIKIGEYLHAKGGIEEMRRVFHLVERRLPIPKPGGGFPPQIQTARSIEYMWSGIGEWQS
jgi:hypothetical protein